MFKGSFYYQILATLLFLEVGGPISRPQRGNLINLSYVLTNCCPPPPSPPAYCSASKLPNPSDLPQFPYSSPFSELSFFPIFSSLYTLSFFSVYFLALSICFSHVDFKIRTINNKNTLKTVLLINAWNTLQMRGIRYTIHPLLRTPLATVFSKRRYALCQSIYIHLNRDLASLQGSSIVHQMIYFNYI